MLGMTEKEVNGIFNLAGFDVKRLWQVKNGYWSTKEAPYWHLVQTDAGLIEIGWRKRVIEIDWSATSDLRHIVTEDQVTKELYMVHASSIPKALEYLTELYRYSKLPIIERL